MKLVLQVIVVLIIAVLAAGCGDAPGGRDLAFTPVTDGQFVDAALDPTEGQATLIVATSHSTRDALARIVGQPIDGDVVVAVFHGTRPTGGYTVTVHAVSLNEEVRVRAGFRDPVPGAPVPAVMTSPFTIVQLPRTDLPTGDVTFVLVDDAGRELDRTDAPVLVGH